MTIAHHFLKINWIIGATIFRCIPNLVAGLRHKVLKVV